MIDHSNFAQIDKIQRHKFSRLFLRIFFVTFVTLTVIIVVLQSFLYTQTRHLLDNELDQISLHQLSNIQEFVDTTRRQMQEIISKISVDTDVRIFLKSQPEDAYNYKDVEARQSIMEKMRGWLTPVPCESVIIYSLSSDRVISNDSGSSPRIHSPEKGFIDQVLQMKLAPAENVYFFREKPHQVGGVTPCISLVLRLESPSRGYGFIVLDIPQQYLIEVIGGKVVHDQSEVFLLDGGGNILLDTASIWTGKTLEALGLGSHNEKQIYAANQHTFTTVIDGETMRFSWMRSTLDSMIYLHTVPYNQYATLLAHLVQTTLISFVIGTVVALLASWVLARYAHKPIRHLMTHINNPRSTEESLDCDEETGYILMKLLLANDKNVQLEQDNLRQFEILQRTRANVLQAQITPHFLYNALQSIQIMILMETGNAKSPAAEAVLALSGITRSLFQKGEDTVSLEEELQYLSQYMFLKKISYPDNLQLEIDVPSELLPLSVPKLCLQPLVENVILHGMTDAKVCQIQIRARLEKGYLTVSVDDNGLGMDEKQIASFNSMTDQEVLFRSQHVGLINLAQRIKLLYGDKASLHLSRSVLGGLCVVFVLPAVKK